MNKEALIPHVAVVTRIVKETPDVKSFYVSAPEGGKPFEHKPGQCAMLSIPGQGESMISITSSPTEQDFIEFSVKKVGRVTGYLHDLEPGSQILVRGPYGRPFPVDTELKGHDLVFVAGGIGLAPLHCVINYVRAKRQDYGNVMVIYGSRSKEDLVDYHEMLEEWGKDGSIDVRLTIDRAEEGWDGHVGFVPNYVKELQPALSSKVLICGPPVMIKFTLAGLKELGFALDQVYTTMEMRMKCGIGKCGRCNIGSKYVCKDGPVFRFDELDALPNEY